MPLLLILKLILLKRAVFDLREGKKKARQRTGGPKRLLQQAV
jgi:hypothetical protein